VKISHLTSDGKQAVLALVQPGELFGELALIDESHRDEFVEAVQTSKVILIPRDEIVRLMEEHPTVSLGITKLIGYRRRRIEQRLKHLLFLSNRDRLAHLLLDLAEDYGRQNDEGVLLDIKLSHQDLASVIGATRETVTITLGQLRSEGYISVGRQRIVLLQPDRLAESVDRLIRKPKAVVA